MNRVFLFLSAINLLTIFFLIFKLDRTGVNKEACPKQETVTLKEESADYDSEKDVANRLKMAENNWRRSNARQLSYLPKTQELSDGVIDANVLTMWDFFYPSFDCPFTKERIGRCGDGGKWICGMTQLSKKPDCIVYSFGIGGETTFEKELLERTNCIIHMYDPTISSKPTLVHKYPKRAIFESLGIFSSNTSNMDTLKRILEKNGHKVIDVLKIDVEGSEWDALENIIQDFSDQLPFAQLQIEIHLHMHSDSAKLKHLKNLWELLENAGLREFSLEHNLISRNAFVYAEFSFVNINLNPFRIKMV